MKQFRLLKADEIECRVSRCSEKGCVILLYKTARTDADLLDETVGSYAWQNDFKVVDGTLYGGIGIYDEPLDTWIWKWDAGTESNTEAEKGRASDAFKRAGFKHGIGRELYSAPFVFIPKGKCNIVEKNGKFQCYDDFEVTAISYEDEKISGLEISLKGSVVFSYGEPVNADTLFCEECGRPIRDGKKKDGSPWKAVDIAAYTKAGWGKQMCVECGTVRAAKAKEINR